MALLDVSGGGRLGDLCLRIVESTELSLDLITPCGLTAVFKSARKAGGHLSPRRDAPLVGLRVVNRS